MICTHGPGEIGRRQPRSRSTKGSRDTNGPNRQNCIPHVPTYGVQGEAAPSGRCNVRNRLSCSGGDISWLTARCTGMGRRNAKAKR